MRASTLETDPGLAAHTVMTDRLEPSAFGALYEQYRVSVYRYLRGRTRSADEALDLTAITFERAFRNATSFRARDGGVHAWLFRIARNTAIDAHRGRRPTDDLTDANQTLRRLAVESDRVDQERAEVLDLVARLPSAQRDALLLRYAGGLTAREIGAVIGKREAAVQKHIERGLATLREAYR
jgi:RNA polymerase sigma-70 factor (ECF subfamily)